jgi:hypothetical protein
MPLLTQAAYARRRGVTRQAIHRQVRDRIIPTHGPRKRIDPVEADRCYVPRMDAGLPQVRMPTAPRATDWTAVRAELAAWRAWGRETADRLARTLGVEVSLVRAVLEPALEDRLLWTGHAIADLDVEG